MHAPPRKHRCPECGRCYSAAQAARDRCLRDIAKIMAEPPHKPHALSHLRP